MGTSREASASQPPAVTRLLHAWRNGEGEAVERLFPLVYDELRQIARRQLGRECPGHTLSATALVHEAYPKLLAQTRTDWRDRAHFYAIAACVMRRLLVDNARKKCRQKRGAGLGSIPLETIAQATEEEQAAAILAVDRALKRLHAMNERQNQVVECRFFGGLTEQETAAALRVSERTVRRDWTLARAWLQRELET